MDTNLRELIHRIAAAHQLDPLLVEAVVTVESGGDPSAWKPEPVYRYFWNVQTRKPFRMVTQAELASETAPKDFPTLAGSREQEWWAQQASWGLMQVMGAVAREQGYDGPYLPALGRPDIGVEFGCRVLAGHLTWAAGALEKALMAYNGGRATALRRGNPDYAAKVLKVYTRLLDPTGTKLA